MPTTWTTTALLMALASVLLLAGSSTAQPIPTPDANDLGVSENDVREEPSHPDDENNFPDDHPGASWSPKEDSLVLDAHVEVDGRLLGREDVDNVVNRALHGENYEDHERTMYPGPSYHSAWWGWWSDHGGGGDLQTDATTSELPGVGEPNGAIDDADDCGDADWDEFTWRSDHPCPDAIQHPAYPGDQMYGFVQPGTQFSDNEVHTHGPYAAVLGNESDGATDPDFIYVDTGQLWRIEASHPRYNYDHSLLIDTSVVSAVNPKELSSGDGVNRYDPYTPAGDAAGYAVDVDIYTTPHPVVEQVYRTAVWDPGDEVGSPADALHGEGLKGWLKDDGARAREDTEAQATNAAEAALETTEPQRGLVNDLVQDPFFHEPNQPGDDYNGWATHDADTSYGGLEGDYYEPGPDQAYPGYQDGERFWFDAQIEINSFPYWTTTAIGYGGTQFTPQAPDPSRPAESVASEDSTTQGPGVLYMHAHAGTWYDGGDDGDADTWVGDAAEDPYRGGTVQDPNTYQAQESATVPSGASGPEWRGTCEVDVEATLHPTSDTDGDGTPDWGAAGVYVMGTFADANPYNNVWSDVIGPDADPVLDPLRNHPELGGAASSLFPEDDERLSRYRTTGPIEVRSWACPGFGHDVGYHPALYNVILPTGTLDFTFEAVTNATLTDQSRVGHHGDTDGTDLAGATITDVDRYGRILPVQP